MPNIKNALNDVLNAYQNKFQSKKIVTEEGSSDILMEIFGITPSQKLGNMQYWGRELGKCWERLIQNTLKTNPRYKPGLKIGRDELCDCIVNGFAIDAKYRVGSGDSGTLKKFKNYGKTLSKKGYKPVALFLRDDNLPAAMTAIKSGGWIIKEGPDSFEFILNLAKFDLKAFLNEKKKGRKFKLVSE